MMQRLLVLIVLWGLSCSLFAQDTTRMTHIISVRFGINQVKDENLHTKTSTGTITELSYGGEKLHKHWQQFYFTLGYSRLKTQLEDVSKTANLKMQLGYAHSFRVVNKSRFQYYLGPEVALAYSAVYLPNWDDSHLYWANYLSAGVRNNMMVPLKRNKHWVTSVTLPVFSLYSRPELYRLYKIDDTSAEGIAASLNSHITPAHLTNTFYLKLNTEIRFPVFQNKTQAFSYRLDYLRVKDDASGAFKQIIHELGITLFL